MKTAHELARELLALPDKPVWVDYWCGQSSPAAKVADGEDGQFEFVPKGDIILVIE